MSMIFFQGVAATCVHSRGEVQGGDPRSVQGAPVCRVEIADHCERGAVEGGTSETKADEAVEGWDAGEDAEHRLGDKDGAGSEGVCGLDSVGGCQHRADARLGVAGNIQFPGGGRLVGDRLHHSDQFLQAAAVQAASSSHHAPAG